VTKPLSDESSLRNRGSSQTDCVIGVDIGGTKVAVGLVDASGKILRSERAPMIANNGPSSGLAAVVAAINSLAADASALRAIGICAPGPLDPFTGVVINPPNLPCWRNFPLAAEISKTWKIPVRIDNDGNAAALAEFLWGAGKGYRNVFYATVGTGVGSGIVFDGHIYHGRTGAAAEGGHVSIDYRGPRCACGKYGCIEALAAGPAIARAAREKLAATSSQSSMLSLAGGKIEDVSSEIVGQAYAKGDSLAQEVLEQNVEYLTIWLGNIVDLLEPDVIIMGGGVSSLLLPFFDQIRKNLPAWCLNSRNNEIPIMLAHYGADAGIAGGAALCSEVLNSER
jgi:glucokinase